MIVDDVVIICLRAQFLVYFLWWLLQVAVAGCAGCSYLVAGEIPQMTQSLFYYFLWSSVQFFGGVGRGHC